MVAWVDWFLYDEMMSPLTTVHMNCKVGDKVLLPDYGGAVVKFGEKEYQMFRDDEILALLKDWSNLLLAILFCFVCGLFVHLFDIDQYDSDRSFYLCTLEKAWLSNDEDKDEI